MAETSILKRTIYFAYGANLNDKTMALRCPAASRMGNAVLSGFCFRINKRGVATVIPHTEQKVEGLVWSLTKADEDKLDSYEGVQNGFYRKDYTDVVCADGNTVQALIYVASDCTVGKPRNGYLENIIQNAITLGFSIDYVNYLESLK